MDDNILAGINYDAKEIGIFFSNTILNHIKEKMIAPTNINCFTFCKYDLIKKKEG